MHPARHPDFAYPFGIEDWTDIRARVIRGPDRLWHVILMRAGFAVLFPGLPFLTRVAAMNQADRVMTAARRVLAGEI